MYIHIHTFMMLHIVHDINVHKRICLEYIIIQKIIENKLPKSIPSFKITFSSLNNRHDTYI